MNLFKQLARPIYRFLRKMCRACIYTIRWGGRGVRTGTTSWISVRATIQGHRGAAITIGRDCEIYPYSMILSHGGNIRIGDRVSLHPFSVINGIGDVWIGSGVRMATSVTIIPGNHIQGTDEIPLTKSGITKIGIRIEDNVWIGAGAIILDGVTVGRNAIIGAGSVVTRDVAPNAKVAGVPARPLVSSSVPHK